MAETAATKSDKDARRDEILAVAFSEFAEKGYAGASMEAIARRAHASKETLYAWFANKKTLFDTLYVHQLDQVRSGAAAAARKDPSPQNVLPVIARDVIKMVIVVAPLSSAAMSAGAQTGTLARQMGRAISDERKNFVNYLNWCREQGYIAFDDDPFEIASLFVAMAQGEWSLRLGTGMIDELTDAMIDTHAERVTRLFLKAIAPAKPKKR